jgi:glycosyltransferase involved in cell wall biosynthesis
VPPRIAIVTPGYPPRLGGIEVVVGHIATELVRLGCRVDVLAQYPGGAEPQAATDPDAPPVRWFRSQTRSERFPVAPSLWTHLRRHGDDYDVIYGHGFHAWPAFAAARATDRPFVFNPHYHRIGHTPMARMIHRAYDRPARRTFDRAAAVLCCSAAESELVRADYPECGDRVHVVMHGVDTEEIMAAEPYQVARPVLLVAGRLEPYKQVRLAIEALPLTGPEADLVVLGAGSDLPALRRAADATGVGERVRFMGRVDGLELHRWQRTASVVLTLSRHEAFGLVLLEGAVAGAAIVASDIPAHREVGALTSGDVEFVAVNAGAGTVAAAVRRALDHRRPPSGPSRPGRVPSWRDVGVEVLRHCCLASGSGWTPLAENRET